MAAPDTVGVAGLVLAAGAGVRLRPLSRVLPKPLCPVLGVPLVDHALATVTDALGPAAGVAVNVCAGRVQMEAHLGGRVHLSVEPTALGTAGAVGNLRRWLDGRAVLVVNGDTWCPADLGPFVAGWDGRTVAVLVSGPPPLHPRAGVVASLLPGPVAAGLAPEPSGLWEVVWRDELAAGRLVSVGHDGPFVDCATPADYLRANREALRRAGLVSFVDAHAEVAPSATVTDSVVGPDTRVEGVVEGCVLWPGAVVHAGERLVDAIRVDEIRTVLVR